MAQAAEGERRPEQLEARPALKVALDLGSILEHCRCSICMGIIKNTRAVSACMHRFCKDCIEAWLRTQIENNCPQCRVKFSSKRDCKPDPIFDLLLGTMFGDIEEFERQMLDPSVEVLEQAKAVGQQIALAKEHAASRRPSPPLPHHAACHQDSPSAQQELQEPRQHQSRGSDATVHIVVAGACTKVPFAPSTTGMVLRQSAALATSDKRQLPGMGGGDAKKQRAGSLGDTEDTGLLQYRGVRFQGDNWQARTKRSGKELSLGLYNTAEEAGMAYDLDRLQQQGGKAQRLNFPLLRQHYKQILCDLADLHTPDGLLDFLAVAVQAAVKTARNVPGSTAPENTGPAAASMLNPRRAIAPAVHAASQPRQGVAIALPPCVAATEMAGADVESDVDEMQAQVEQTLPPIVQHAVARQQAKLLALERPLVVGLANSMAHVRLEAGSGLAWRMAYMSCPAAATISQLSKALALGVGQQHGLPPGWLQVGMAVANDLDASADFNALYYEDTTTGNLLLRGHVTIRDLLATLQTSLEDLSLEYHVTEKGEQTEKGNKKREES